MSDDLIGRDLIARKAQVVYWTPLVGRIGPAACAIGAFDGVHLGHQFLISSMVASARRIGAAAVVATFDIDPDEFFLPPERRRKLLSNPDRVELLTRLGADVVLVVPFAREMSELSFDVFLQDVLGRFMSLRSIHVGLDFRLGHNAAGTVDSMREWGTPKGIVVNGYDLLEREGHPVTASRIRELIAVGDTSTASRLLGRPFYVRGTVVEGRHEGAKLGFPTANVSTTVPYAPIADGVYSGWCSVDGRCLPAAINAGYPRTFEGERDLCRLEPHIIGYEGDLYNKELVVSFDERLRGPVRFESLEALKQGIAANVAWTRKHVKERSSDKLGFPLEV